VALLGCAVPLVDHHRGGGQFRVHVAGVRLRSERGRRRAGGRMVEVQLYVVRFLLVGDHERGRGRPRLLG
jgi:hypothetical protein